MQTDAELVKTVLNGNKNSYEVLVKRYERSIRAVALGILRDYHSASDVSQDAFIKAFENLAGLRKPDAFGPWLMKIAHRYALNAAGNKPENRPEDLQIGITTENPGDRLNEDKQVLLAAVVRLPKAEKQVVMLRYFGQNSVKDVAEIVGRSIGTVTKQLSRAHKRLRKMLSETETKL